MRIFFWIKNPIFPENFLLTTLPLVRLGNLKVTISGFLSSCWKQRPGLIGGPRYYKLTALSLTAFSLTHRALTHRALTHLALTHLALTHRALTHSPRSHSPPSHSPRSHSPLISLTSLSLTSSHFTHLAHTHLLSFHSPCVSTCKRTCWRRLGGQGLTVRSALFGPELANCIIHVGVWRWILNYTYICIIHVIIVLISYEISYLLVSTSCMDSFATHIYIYICRPIYDYYIGQYPIKWDLVYRQYQYLVN